MKRATSLLTFEVTSAAEAHRASKSAGNFASRLGFTGTDCEEIALVVAELASNLIKHARGGKITIGSMELDRRIGIQIESVDHGPGIPDIERALTDGYSTAGSLGTGLGTVNRLMDELEFRAVPHHPGLHVICQRWTRPSSNDFPVRRLEFGAATRSYRLQPENGDAIVLRQWDGHALTGVVDGLGHGQFAKKAAQAARLYIEQHFAQPLTSLFRGVGRTCRATRGVVMALARFDLETQKLAIANVGNVEVRLIGEDRASLVVRRGIIGLNAPDPIITEHPWTQSSLLVVHSDGLQAQWQSQEIKDLKHQDAGVIAVQMLRKFGRMEDDATVVVVKSASP